MIAGHRWQIVAGLVLVAALNALCYPLIVIGSAYAPHLTLAALRAVIAGLALAAIAALLDRPLPKDGRSWFALCGIGLGATTLGYFGMFHAAEFVSPGLATIVANSQPLITALLAWIFLSERLRKIQYVGLALGFLGIVGISVDQLSGAQGMVFTRGLAYISLAILGVAGSNILMKAIRTTVDPLIAMATQSFIGAIPLMALALVFERPLQIQPTPPFFLALIGLALPGTALASWLWFSILDRVPLGQANAFTFLTPFIAVAIGILFFDEFVGIAVIAGLVVTGVGVFLVEGGATRVSSPEPALHK